MKAEGFDFGDFVEILVVLAWVFGGQIIRLFRKFFGGESQEVEPQPQPEPISAPEPRLPQEHATELVEASLPETIQTIEELEAVEAAMEAASAEGWTLRHQDYERIKHLLGDYDKREVPPQPSGEITVLSEDVHFPTRELNSVQAAREAFVLREILQPPRGISPFFSRTRRSS